MKDEVELASYDGADAEIGQGCNASSEHWLFEFHSHVVLQWLRQTVENLMNLSCRLI